MGPATRRKMVYLPAPLISIPDQLLRGATRDAHYGAQARTSPMLAQAALRVVVLMPPAHGRGRNREAMTDGPLAGFRILDLSSVISGPFCTMLLGDLGADIIKIEAPEGDTLRTFSRPQKNGMSAGFL